MTTPFLAALILFGFLARPQQEAGPYQCPPCGEECHFVVRDVPGTCSACGMGLVPISTVPQVGVLVFPGVDASSSLLALTVFGASDSVRAFTVADTVDPIRASDLLEFVPQFDFEHVPQLDVLIVPAGFGSEDDPLIVEWVKQAAGRARFVLGVGLGNVILARAGCLDGARVPGFGRLTPRVKEWAPKLDLDEDARLVRNGRFFAARNAMATLEGVLAIVAELKGEERARRTAESLGYDWDPALLEEGR